MTSHEIAVPVEATPVERRWRPATRVAFRFCFLYFGLYIVLTQMLTSLLFAATNDNGAFELDMTRPAQAVITWVAAHVFHAAHIVTAETGSGDRVYDWVELVCILALAVVGALVWSLLDRRRLHYTGLFRWFRVVMRFALGATLLTYGAVKIFPLQMQPPSFYRLLEPYGNFSPMGVLWASIGAAPLYELFAGCAEFLGGALLLFPRTAVLGALIALADAIQVFMLNMSYDVPVKLMSFILILLALIVLAPEAGRLWNATLGNRPMAPSEHFRLCRGRRANRIAAAVQAGCAVALIATNLYAASRMVMPPPAASPPNGLWTVESFTLAGQPHPPLTTDPVRWQHVIVAAPHEFMAQTMPGAFDYYNATLESGGGAGPSGAHGSASVSSASPALGVAAVNMTLSAHGKPNFHASLRWQFTAPGKAELSGSFGGQPLDVGLRRVDRSAFLLLRRGFHWVQDYPFNR